MRHTLNIVVGGFIGSRETNSAQRRYTRQILSVENLPEVETKGKCQTSKTVITFSEEDVANIHLDNDDPMVIIVNYGEWEIKRVLVDKGVLQTYYIGRRLK